MIDAVTCCGVVLGLAYIGLFIGSIDIAVASTYSTTSGVYLASLQWHNPDVIATTNVFWPHNS